MNNKKCSKCGVEKPATTEYFNKCRNSLQSWCKECKKKHHEANKEEILKKRREKWRAEHPLEVIPEGMKKCCKCGEIKPKTSEFFNKLKKAKDGFKYECKECKKNEYTGSSAKYIENSRKRYMKKRKEISAKNKIYKQKNEERYKEYYQKYYEIKKAEIKENVRKYRLKRSKEDVGFRLMARYRTRVYKALKGIDKSKTTQSMIGCSIEFLKAHLESNFTDGMNWDNYGKWHVDHIRPCASFDLKLEQHQKECFHYTNLQPLWAEDNLRKSDSFDEASL